MRCIDTALRQLYAARQHLLAAKWAGRETATHRAARRGLEAAIDMLELVECGPAHARMELQVRLMQLAAWAMGAAARSGRTRDDEEPDHG